MGRAERNGELFLGEYRPKILRICERIVPILPFKVVIRSTREGVRFLTEFTGPESDDHIESGEVLGPPSLSSSERLGSGEIFEIFVVCNDVHSVMRRFEVMSPRFEGLKNR